MTTPSPHSVTATLGRQTSRIRRVLTYIDKHLDEPLDVQRLADIAAFSRFHFHRVFSAHLGCSIGTYVTQRRLLRACSLLRSRSETVLHIALDVGYDSAQALAKAMKRELGISPSVMRHGDANGAWQRILADWQISPDLRQQAGASPMNITRYADLPANLVALTATAHGMVNHTMNRAAQQAFGELAPTIQNAGLWPRASSWLAICPDTPQGPDDPDCRYVAGVLFGHALANGEGQCEQPDIALSGSLAWQTLSAGRYAVFTHIGPYTALHKVWTRIYRDWLPASGHRLRDTPPLELMRNNPDETPAEKLHTEIWIPVA